MCRHNKQRFTSLSRRLIALISVIVPRRFRTRWRREWEAELQYRETLLARWGRLDWDNKLELLRRSLGAFWDALLLQPRRLEDEMFQDLRYGARMLLKSKMFTLVALLSLALGIGANTAIFSSAVVGRTLIEADDNPANAEPVAVISHGFWQRRFGLDPGVVGRRITINDTVYTIAGVAPPGFFGIEVGTRPELWTPIKPLNDPRMSKRLAWTEQVMGRLRLGVSLAQAQAEMDVFFRQYLDDFAGAQGANWTPAQRRQHFEPRIRLEAGSAGWTDLRQRFRQPLLILMMTVALVLLIACVNIANLLLARAASRRKEIAVRLSLGAGRFRLIRQLLTESVLLAMLGGAAGLLFARACARALVV